MRSSRYKIKNQNVNGNDGEHIVKRYSFVIVHKDGTEEDLSKTMTTEELRSFLLDHGMVEEAEAITDENICAANPDLTSLDDEYSDYSYDGSKHPYEDLLSDYVDSEDRDEECDSEEEYGIDFDEKDDSDWDEDSEDGEDSDNKKIVFVEVDDDQEEENLEDDDCEDVCPICGCRDIDYLDRGKMVGGIAGGVLGLTRNGIVKTFLPNVVSRGVSGIIGYAVGNVAGRVLDKKVLNNRKCTHCGYEWHVDEDLF